jgi:zinc finger protein
VPESIIEDAVCPACGHKGMVFHSETVDLPFLGESLETMLRCAACGYRHTDFVLLATRDPTRFSYRVTEEADMAVRVVRSASGTIRIPELGIHIEPGVASEAFISNVEGILVRVERVLDQLHRDAGDEAQVKRIEELQETFARMRDGKADPVTLVLEDPYGNSAILAAKAVSEPIPPEEAERLQTGLFVFDKDGDMAPPGGVGAA